jgi:hypothetical protein
MAMMSLRESLEELMEASANKVLMDGASLEGRQEVARMALLLSMIEQLDADQDLWDECDLLPETIPLLTGLPLRPTTTLLQ